MNRIRNFLNHVRNVARQINRRFLRPVSHIAVALTIAVVFALIANYFLLKQPELYNVCPEFFDILNGYITVYRYILISGGKILVGIFNGTFFRAIWEFILGCGELLQQFGNWLTNIRF